MSRFQRVCRWLAIVAIATTLAACQPGKKPVDIEDQPQPLLLISIDGFRHDYFDLAELPAIQRLVNGGLTADSLHHVFPTKTFPTHYTMVTGRHPGTHGVVANGMWDPIRDERFSLGNREAVGDGFWYQGGEPIWVTAENQGLRAATFFWPGSEARIHRVRPTHWVPYDSRYPHAERIDQVLEWFDLPESERPSFYTLYFSSVDSMGHRHGPRAEPVRDALIDVDHHLGTLFDGLESRGLLDQVNILLVSDHGMSWVDFDQYILLDDYLNLSRVRVSDWGPAAQIWATDMDVEDIMDALVDAHPKMRVWRREDIPARYRFGTHHRVPDVLAEADLEWMISNRPHRAGRETFSLMGMHGWDPAWLEMHGLFVAHGPAFTAGSRAPAVRSIDLYALMTHLLDLEPAEHEGSLAALQPFLHTAERHYPQRLSFVCDDEQGFDVAIGPAHAALTFGQFVHVLDEQPGDNGHRRWQEVDLSLEITPTGASARIDDQRLENCRQN